MSNSQRTMTISKVELPLQVGQVNIPLPNTAVTLTVGFIGPRLFLWIMYEVGSPQMPRQFLVLPDGVRFPPLPANVDLNMIGRAEKVPVIVTANGQPMEPEVFHIFEVFAYAENTG